MARPTALQRLNRQFAEQYGSKAVTTQQGRQSWDEGENYKNLQAIIAALRNRRRGVYEIPSRDKEQAMLMQEIYWVCAFLAQGIQEQANDAANDSMADTQPDAIIVRGELSAANKRKFRNILRDGFRRLKIGENGSQRIRRALKTGNCFGQKVFEWDGARWHLTKIVYMPTYEMVRNPTDNSYMQIRNAGMRAGGTMIGGNNVIGQWAPGFIANLVIEEDQNAIYGVPLLEHVKIDYNLFVAACQDAAIASRTRAPMRFKWKYGNEKGMITETPESLDVWKKRHTIEPTTVMTDVWLLAGLEDVEAIGGDAAGLRELSNQVDGLITRMKKACGFREDSGDLAGRGLESMDARYSTQINALRIADWKFKKSVGDALLLLEGYDEVDWSTNIPSLGETDHNRSTRLGTLLGNAHIGHELFAAGMGYKDVDDYREDLTETAQFYDKLNAGLETIQIQYQLRAGSGKKTDQTRSPRGDVVGSDSPKKGADPQASRGRRKQQTDSGKTPTGARASDGALLG